MQDKLPIAIVSDLACPWCFIGKARLEKALDSHGLTDRVAITWLPYELNPDMPAEGMDRTAYLEAKFGAGKRKEIEIRLSEAALESGVTFNWARVTKSVNTRMAHMLVAAASTVQRGTEMKAALFKAYWQDGRDIGDLDTLVAIAVEQGFDEQAARDELTNEELRETVVGLESHAQQVGVTGVPFFIIDGKLAVSGAQTGDVWAQVFAQALEQQPAMPQS
ncbi:MAG TPA: DsbA family oxidoreductase [Bosea sp. (in: a-proteobacteria)]|jgi:predicted DsbA family dithiol-disulfide isomerase|uniref:DsbA family oxidoreductase n=1 Tax=Bosea sp. (in: a-proteobacteria) TaxID=1871050 RepID=UPI002DDCC13A|nr:DsbA family oxidoreductase [Bosea sp. (in: a-proteobacteria)]HEV2553564.1 DsbA family oxidoreductase [Bosea sp. (in: a-proteobacteria)]